MRAVLYCRVSTKEQVENYSLETQERVCRRYCQEHKLEVDRVFIEEGESAKTADRTRLKELLDYCKKNKGRVTHVVVYHCDRLARQAYDHHVVRTLLGKMNITLRSATQPIDDSATGKLMENISAAVAQFENDQKSARTVEGMKAALAQGRWTHQAPLGYRSGKTKTGPSLQPDPERAELIRRAFEWQASGQYAKSEIAIKLNALGFRTKKDGQLRAQTLNKILANPLYAGWIRLPKWSVNVKGDFEPLISLELFTRVNPSAKFGAEAIERKRSRNNPQFPLRQTVLCDKCGKPLTASSPRGHKGHYAYYHCHRCGGKNFPKELVEKKFRALVKRLKPSPEIMALFTEIVRNRWEERNSEALRSIDRLQKRAAELGRMEDKLVDALLGERIDQETYDRQTTRLKSDLGSVRAELERVKGASDLDIDGILTFASKMLPQGDTSWQQMSHRQKGVFQKAVFPAGVVFNGRSFRTPEMSWIFKPLKGLKGKKSKMASPGGFEPPFPP